MKRLTSSLFAGVLGAILLWPAGAAAIPAFARRYSATCNMCHSAFPRLNDFGVRFRDNGYRIPGRESEEKMLHESLPPLAGRTSGGLNIDRFTATPDATDVTRVQLDGLDLLAGGYIGLNAGFFLVYTPPLPASRATVEQPSSLEMANVVFADVLARGLDVRVGRFEPEIVPFSVARRLTVAPYEIYDFVFPGGAPPSDTQEGIEVAGTHRSFRYAVGWVNGAGTLAPHDVPLDLYLRLANVFGPGEGQTAGQRVGLTGELGEARPLAGGDRRMFYRLGLDASLNLAQWNLGVQAFFSSDNGELWGVADPVNVYGGFGELSYQPWLDLVAFARFDAVLTPTSLEQGDILKLTVGLRYYFTDELALHLEAFHRHDNSRAPGATLAQESLLTLRLDWAF